MSNRPVFADAKSVDSAHLRALIQAERAIRLAEPTQVVDKSTSGSPVTTENGPAAPTP